MTIDPVDGGDDVPSAPLALEFEGVSKNYTTHDLPAVAEAADKLEAIATVTLEPGTEGPPIKGSAIDLVGTVPGIDEA